MKNLLDILKENIGDGEFLLKTVEKQSYELFFVHRKLETVRATSTTDKKVTVYVNHENFKGDYTFSVYASSTEADVIEKINAAKEQAAKINNEFFTLPAAETLEGEPPSSLAEYPVEETGQKIAAAVFAAEDDEDGGSINATEIFINTVTFTVDNSNGLHKKQIKRSAFVEAIPTWTENGDSVELYEAYRFTELDERAITEEIASRMREVRDRYRAKTPDKKLSCPVVIRARELSNVIGAITDDISYGNVYVKGNSLSKGDALQGGGKCDPLNVRLLHELKGSPSSALFDGDGAAFSDVDVIKDGKIISLYGGNRHAQYLKEKPTGNLPCALVECGSLSAEELKKAPYLECVSMSGIQVDLNNDYIGGEVRLAYYHDGDKCVPLTGITLSGSLKEALAGIRLSDTPALAQWFSGPSCAMLGGIKIL